MKQEIVDRLTAAMRRDGLDAIVTTSPENFGYVTGFVVPSHPLMRWRHAMAAITADGRAALLVVDMEATTTRRNAPGADIRIWGEFTDDPMAHLAALLEEFGLSCGRIGIEMDHLPAGDFARLSARLPKAALTGAENLLDRQRQIKTADEIALLRRLSRISDGAIADALAAVGAGDTEQDIAAALTRSLYARGAERFTLMIIATGERSVLPNVGPTERVLRPGDVCRIEVFSIIGGYHAGVCRTAVVGEAPPHAERIWANLVEAKYLLLRMIRPGVSSKAVYEAFLGKLAETGLPPIAFVGHGIGLHLHEFPYLGGGTDQPLEAGMVLSIEPLVYETGYGFGLQNKDMIVVTENGCELLSDVTDTDRLIKVGRQPQ